MELVKEDEKQEGGESVKKEALRMFENKKKEKV